MYNVYFLGPDKSEIKKVVWSSVKLLMAIAFLLVMLKKVSNSSDKEKYMLVYKNLQLYLKLGPKIKNIHRVLEFDQSKWLTLYIKFNAQKGKEVEKNGDKDGSGF